MRLSTRSYVLVGLLSLDLILFATNRIVEHLIAPNAQMDALKFESALYVGLSRSVLEMRFGKDLAVPDFRTRVSEQRSLWEQQAHPLPYEVAYCYSGYTPVVVKFDTDDHQLSWREAADALCDFDGESLQP